MDMGNGGVTVPLLTLLSYIRDFTISIYQSTLISNPPDSLPYMATFETLTTFKDGHHFKEGHFEMAHGLGFGIAPPPLRTPFFVRLLDYTCNVSERAIWGKSVLLTPVLAILWLRTQSRDLARICILLIILYLQKISLSRKLERQFEEFCPNLIKVRNGR
jgi:hypothetical protein